MARRTALAATASSCLALFGCSTQNQAPSSGLVVADVTVVSPEREAPLEHAYVRILDGRILEVS
jgi:hypothetical protein